MVLYLYVRASAPRTEVKVLYRPTAVITTHKPSSLSTKRARQYKTTADRRRPTCFFPLLPSSSRHPLSVHPSRSIPDLDPRRRRLSFCSHPSDVVLRLATPCYARPAISPRPQLILVSHRRSPSFFRSRLALVAHNLATGTAARPWAASLPTRPPARYLCYGLPRHRPSDQAHPSLFPSPNKTHAHASVRKHDVAVSNACCHDTNSLPTACLAMPSL